MTDNVKNDALSPFKHKVRVRSCGLLVENNRILLLKHMGLGKKGHLWSPPGGGVQFGEDAHGALIREFKEEINLTIAVGSYICTREFISEELHAIELFFEVRRLSGSIKLGHDPELPENGQILTEYAFLNMAELRSLDQHTIHSLLGEMREDMNFMEMKGFKSFKSV